MSDLVFQYYGIDLVATGLTLVGIYQVGNKQKAGFVSALIGNSLWLAFGVMSASAGILIANLAIAALNLRGYRKWSAENGKRILDSNI